MSLGMGKETKHCPSLSRRLCPSSCASTDCKGENEGGGGKGEKEGGAGTAGLGPAEVLRLPGQMQH